MDFNVKNMGFMLCLLLRLQRGVSNNKDLPASLF
jgi:hypothetical protein